MRPLLLLVSAVIAAPVAAQQREAAQERGVVVVTATPLAATAQRLEQCLARHCPPADDISASLAHAENLLVAGNYSAARLTLGKARSRNIRYAEALPLEVAGLTRAHGRLLDLDGDPRRSVFSQIDALEALKTRFPGTDSQVLVQQIEVGDAFARSGRADSAERVYRRVEKRARSAGLTGVAGHAMLRQAMLLAALANVSPEYALRAEHAIRRIERTTDPGEESFRRGARLLRASMAAYRGDTDGVEKALDSGALRVSRPVLLFAPTVRLGSADTIPYVQDAGGAPEWVDVRFRIDSEGRVGDVELLRQSSNVSSGWPELVRSAVMQRRYAPLALAADSPVLTRIERFSLVYDRVDKPGSRLQGRTSGARMSALDLTPDS